MGKRRSDEVAKQILSFLMSNFGQAYSIQDIAKETGVSWESVKRYVELLSKVEVIQSMQRDNQTLYAFSFAHGDGLFQLKVPSAQVELSQKIYGTIQKLWPEYTSRPITKTVVQKIAVAVANQRFDEIPRGWYKFGKLLSYQFDPMIRYPSFEAGEDIDIVKQYMKVYCSLSSSNARTKQYELEKNDYYMIKERLSVYLKGDLNNPQVKNKLRELLNQFAFGWGRKEKNSELLAVIEDFCSTSLLVLRNEDPGKLAEAGIVMAQAFEQVWDMVATYEYYESMQKFYEKEVLGYVLLNRIFGLMDNSTEYIDELRAYVPEFRKPTDEVGKKLLALKGSATELSEKEKRKRIEQLESIRKEKGDKAVNEYLFKLFGID